MLDSFIIFYSEKEPDWYPEAYVQFVLWLWSTLVVAYLTFQCLPAVLLHFHGRQSNFNSEPVGSPEAQLE